MRKNLFIYGCFLLAMLTASTSANADEILDALQEAQSAYQQKDYKATGAAAQKVINGVHELISQEVVSYLPGDIPGWKRGEASTTSAGEITFGTPNPNTFSVEVSYLKEEGGGQVTVIISNIPHVVQIAKAGAQLLSNPFFTKMSEQKENAEKAEEYQLGNFKGIKKINPSSKRIEYAIFIHDHTLVQVKGSNIENMDGIEQFIQGVDINNLEKFSSS